MRDFVAHVKALRVAAGLTLPQAARRCRLNVENFRDIQGARVEPRLTHLLSLGHGLQVSSDVLFGNLLGHS